MKRIYMTAIMLAGISVSISAGPKINVLSHPANSISNSFYPGSTQPLQNLFFIKLPLNAINPGGY
ncbi:MAG: hypothetical protein ACM3Q2_16240, partial [Syntrophothermus sp.]